MTLATLLPQAQFLLVTTPQPTAQKVARRAAEMAGKVSLEIAGVVENMSGFTTPSGERFQLFGEGGGQELADELDVPLLGKVPLTMPLREQADAGLPLVFTDPDDPAAQSIRQAARGLVALFPVRAADAAGGASGAAGRSTGSDRASSCRSCRPSDLRGLLEVVRVDLRVLLATPRAAGPRRSTQSTGQASTQASQSMHSSGSI